MPDITRLPTRAEFIRDRLAEHLCRNAYYVSATDNPAPEVFLGGLDAQGEHHNTSVLIKLDGTVVDYWRSEGEPLEWVTFAWSPIPTDTGVMHGPRCSHSMRGGRCLASCDFMGGHRVPGTTRTV